MEVRDAALSLIALDERLHPRGALAEERSVLEIEALTALGRRREASAARARFSAAYPDSIHRARIGER